MTTYDEIKSKVIKLVKRDSKYLTIFKKLIALDERAESMYGTMYRDIGFSATEASDEGIPIPDLVVLARIHKVLGSVIRDDGSYGYYLIDREAVADAVDELLGVDRGVSEISDDLFAGIEGYESKKRIILMALRSKRPVHILLAGSPGTAKTLFLLALSRLKGAVYAIGSRASKAGIAKYIYEYRPKYLIIDEIDKMRWEDQAVLLSLMETGIVSVMLKNERFNIRTDTRVIGACNYEGKLDRALRDRFLIIRFKEYTPQEYVNIMPKILVNREHIDPDLANYIVQKLVRYTRSPREAIRIARIAKSKEDVDSIINEVYEGGLAI